MKYIFVLISILILTSCTHLTLQSDTNWSELINDTNSGIGIITLSSSEKCSVYDALSINIVKGESGLVLGNGLMGIALAGGNLKTFKFPGTFIESDLQNAETIFYVFELDVGKYSIDFSGTQYRAPHISQNINRNIDIKGGSIQYFGELYRNGCRSFNLTSTDQWDRDSQFIISKYNGVPIDKIEKQIIKIQ